MKVCGKSLSGLAMVVSVALCACPGGGDGGSEDAGVELKALDGVWQSEAGLRLVFEGDIARLTAFGGRVTGRAHFDVGDVYIDAIERVAGDSFAGQRVRFELADVGDDILHIQGVSASTSRVTIEIRESRIEISDDEGSTTFSPSYSGPTAYEHGGACEDVIGSDDQGLLYDCDDSGTRAMCKTPLSYGEFWENTTCRQLGYSYEYAPAEFWRSSSDKKAGEHGYWGDHTGGSGAGWSDGSGGGALEGGPMSAEDLVDGGVPLEDAGAQEPSDAGAQPGVSYLVYGVAWGPATWDCPEASHIFDDALGYRWHIVVGDWSDTYDGARSEVEAGLMADYPGARSYNIQSSWFTYGPNARHAVLISYVHDLAPWDCRAHVVTIGYGTSYEDALAAAVESKANNDSASAPYMEIDHVMW